METAAQYTCEALNKLEIKLPAIYFEETGVKRVTTKRDERIALHFHPALLTMSIGGQTISSAVVLVLPWGCAMAHLYGGHKMSVVPRKVIPGALTSVRSFIQAVLLYNAGKGDRKVAFDQARKRGGKHWARLYHTILMESASEKALSRVFADTSAPEAVLPVAPAPAAQGAAFPAALEDRPNRKAKREESPEAGAPMNIDEFFPLAAAK
jgi:hypothetical protein